MQLSLRQKFLALVIGLLLGSIGLIGAAVLYSTDATVQTHAKERLTIGQRVFERLLAEHTAQILDTASVLVSDFGFKQAVTSQDAPTIESALENAGQRIAADLVMLVSNDGQLIAQVGANTWAESTPIQPHLKQATLHGAHSAIVLWGAHIYQLVLLPVKAPLPVAWAVIGLEIDADFAQQLKDLTNLDVSFVAYDAEKIIYEVSTLLSTARNETQDFVDTHLSITQVLHETAGYRIEAQLHASLQDAYAAFSTLQAQLLSIAGVALFLSVLGALITARNITRPIAELVRAAKGMSAGDYQQRIQYDAASLEIRTLGQSFEQMQRLIAEREELLSRQAYIDPLTELASRAAIHETLRQLTQEHSPGFFLVRLNINGFKEINDTFGYEVGDQVLKDMAQTLRHMMPSPGCAARLGADEFALIALESSPGRRETLILDLLEQLQQPIDSNRVRASFVRMGVAVYPDHGEEAETLLRRAEIALNSAKDHKQAYAYYLSGQDESHRRQIRLVADLAKAIEHNQLKVYYQPKFDLDAGRVTQAEALLRWIHEDFGFVPPDEFVALAEQSGQMTKLTQWVIHSVAAQRKRWKEAGIAIDIAINLSAYDLNERLPAFLAATLSTHELSASALILEVTESAVMSNPQQAVAILSQLRQMGFLLSIDDFGTGYSSLAQLKLMPLNELKIDKSFVLKLDQDPDDQIIVRSTIELARNLGLSVVAEGTETLAACQLLKQWGCRKLQGYFFSPPLPAEKFEQWLREKAPAYPQQLAIDNLGDASCD